MVGIWSLVCLCPSPHAFQLEGIPESPAECDGTEGQVSSLESQEQEEGPENGVSSQVMRLIRVWAPHLEGYCSGQ